MTVCEAVVLVNADVNAGVRGFVLILLLFYVVYSFASEQNRQSFPWFVPASKTPQGVIKLTETRGLAI